MTDLEFHYKKFMTNDDHKNFVTRVIPWVNVNLLAKQGLAKRALLLRSSN